MSIVVDPIDDAATKAVRNVLLQILPEGTEVVLFDVNRVPSAQAPNYVVMHVLNRGRLATNVDTMDDCRFTASIESDRMTVTAVDYGALAIGRRIFGPDVLDGTEVVGFLSSGPLGGPGAYQVSKQQTVSARVLAAGQMILETPTDLTIQLDFHGLASGTNAQTAATIFRDDYGVRLFEEAGGKVVPLYTDDPKNLPFIDGADQFELRWAVDCHLQVDQTVLNVPQQAAENLEVGVVNVDAKYPPT